MISEFVDPKLPPDRSLWFQHDGSVTHTAVINMAAKVEGIMPKAAWHWGRDSSVVNDPLGEPGHASLYVGLPFAWGSMDDLMFFSPYIGGLLFGDSSRHA